MNTISFILKSVSIALISSGTFTLAADQAPGATESGEPGSQEFDRYELRQLIADTRAERADFLEARRVLREQLAEANTREERRALFQQFWEEHRDMILGQRAFRRQFHLRRMEIRRERRAPSADPTDG